MIVQVSIPVNTTATLILDGASMDELTEHGMKVQATASSGIQQIEALASNRVSESRQLKPVQPPTSSLGTCNANLLFNRVHETFQQGYKELNESHNFLVAGSRALASCARSCCPPAQTKHTRCQLQSFPNERRWTWSWRQSRRGANVAGSEALPSHHNHNDDGKDRFGKRPLGGFASTQPVSPCC